MAQSVEAFRTVGPTPAPRSVERRDRATMKDVAALAGVGMKTVSRVFNDVPTVAPDLVQRDREAADKLGYRPNLTAASLRRSGGRTNTIGLLLEDVSNPYSSSVHRAVEDHARQRGALVLAGSLDEDPLRERELARALIDRRVDGLIIMPAGHDHRWLLSEQLAGTCFVFIDRPPTPLLADAVVSDNRGGAYDAVSHLLRQGRRRIAYLGDDLDISTAAERFLGYRTALGEAGLAVDHRLCHHGLRDAAAARRAAEEILSAHAPDGMFTSQNVVTLGAVEALHARRQELQVALVGFDDIPLAGLVRPGISVVTQDVRRIGEIAAQRLFDRLAGDESPPAVHRIATHLLARGSGELTG